MSKLWQSLSWIAFVSRKFRFQFSDAGLQVFNDRGDLAVGIVKAMYQIIDEKLTAKQREILLAHLSGMRHRDIADVPVGGGSSHE